MHAVVGKLDSGLFPGAFCKISKDVLTGDPQKCNIIHADGSGTKSIIAYLHYREHNDPSVFRGIAQDSIVMNLDDLLCVGVYENIVLSSTINRNARNIPQEVLAALIQGTEDFLRHLRSLGLNIHSGGGETADVGDLTGTVTVDSCAVAVVPKNKIVDNANIASGLSIIGISSSGKATYESFENSGIASNGLTSARHDLLSSYYAKYLESVDGQMDTDFSYTGPYRLEEALPHSSSLTIGQALLSPTRTYAPIIAALLKTFPKAIKGLVHCSGGGQTKCLRFGSNVHYVKDKLFPLPPIFKVIQEVSNTPWKEMFQVYNMGHRMEVYCDDAKAADILDTIKAFGIKADVIGYTEKSHNPDSSNHLTLKYGKEALSYSV